MNWMMKYQMMIKSMNIQLEMRMKQNSFKKWMRKEEWMIKDYMVAKVQYIMETVQNKNRLTLD